MQEQVNVPKAVKQDITYGSIIILDDDNFNSDKTAINDTGKKLLDSIAGILKSDGHYLAKIQMQNGSGDDDSAKNASLQVQAENYLVLDRGVLSLQLIEKHRPYYEAIANTTATKSGLRISIEYIDGREEGNVKYESVQRDSFQTVREMFAAPNYTLPRASANVGSSSAPASQQKTVKNRIATHGNVAEKTVAKSPYQQATTLVKTASAINTEVIPKPTLAYNYPRKIRQGSTAIIYVHVNVKAPSVVKAELKEIIANEYDSSINHDTVVYTIFIKPYKYLTVRIEDPGHIFSINDSLHPARQMIDTLNGNDWKWTLTTKSNEKNALLIIHSQGENSDSSGLQAIDDKNISMQIELDNDIGRGVISYFTENPGDFALKVLLPFFSFLAALFWFIVKRKSKDSDKS